MEQIKFPTLHPKQISVKVKQVTQKGAVALLYKSARVDMDMLDLVFGPANWMCDYKEIKGNLYCGIAVNCDGNWIWKWDCGIESAQGDGNEKKAEASDAFKRAGFRWGIGRELYTAPFVFLRVGTKQNGNKWELEDKFARFHVESIDYEDSRITGIVIADEHGKELFRYGCNPAKTDQQPRQDERRSGTITTEQLAELNQLFTPARIAGMCSFYRVSRAEELSQGQASVIIAKRRREIEREAKQ